MSGLDELPDDFLLEVRLRADTLRAIKAMSTKVCKEVIPIDLESIDEFKRASKVLDVIAHTEEEIEIIQVLAEKDQNVR